MRNAFLMTLTGAMLIALLPEQTAKANMLPTVRLVMWYQEESGVMDKLGIQQIFDSWAAQNAPGSTLTMIPKVAEELESDYRSTSAEQRPDLLWAAADFVKPLALAHLIQPIDNIIDTKLLIPTLIAVTQVNGNAYGIPIQVGNYLMLYYNKKMVKQAPKTFIELVAVARDLAAKNGSNDKFVPFAYHQYDAFWVFPIAHGFGATEFDADGKTPALNTEGWIKAYQLLLDLKFNEKIESRLCDFECVDAGFKAGTTAMILNVDWTLYGDSGYIKALGDDLGVAPLPSVGTVPTSNIPVPFVSGMYLLLSQTLEGDKRQTASAFARVLATDEETTLKWTLPSGRLPALKSALKNAKIVGNPIFQVSSEVALMGIAQPVGGEMDCIWRAVAKQNALIMGMATTPDNAAKNGQNEAAGCIAALG